MFGYTILYVKDVVKTIAFYENAFGFKRKFITAQDDYGELSSGETTLAFASVELGNSNLRDGFQESDTQQKPFAMQLSFVTEHLKEDLDRAIKAGAIALEPIRSKPWGQQVAYVRDINGFLIEICTPIQ